MIGNVYSVDNDMLNAHSKTVLQEEKKRQGSSCLFFFREI